MGLLSNVLASIPTSLPEGLGGPYIWGYVAFSSSMMLFEQYLEVRQLRRNRDKNIPEEVKVLGVEEDKFIESQVYQSDKRLFGMVQSWITFAFSKTTLFLVNPLAWKFAASVMGAENEAKTTLLWLFIMQWIDKPLSIMFDLYKNFVVEERHGFNKMTLGLYCTDFIKSELLTYFFGGLLVPGLIWLVRWGGENFYLYVWGAVQALVFAMMWIYPSFIQPLFNKFEPLQNEELRVKIEELAAEEKFPLTKLFQIDGSKRSAHSNAYMFGFGRNKRIVLYDTLFSMSHEEILAILCHELGHWKFMHTLMNIAISSAHLFVLFYLFGVVMYSGDTSKAIVRSFGYENADAVMVSPFTYMMLIEPVEQLVVLGITIKSRANEFQADGFAVSKGRGADLRTGLLQLCQENKGDLNPDPLYSWYHHSHPPLVERLSALKIKDA